MSAELIESTERAPGLPRAIDSDRCERECDAALLPLLPLLPGASTALLVELLRAAYSFGRRDATRDDLGRR